MDRPMMHALRSLKGGAMQAHTREALRIALFYAVFGAAWIYFSDRLFALLASGVADLTSLQTWKGWGFILLTAALIFLLTRRALLHRTGLARQLEHGQADYQALFVQSPIGLALCRMDGTLVEVNPAFARILGRSVAETLGLTYWQITPDSYAGEEARQLEALEQTGRYGPYEKEYLHADGHRVPVRLSGLRIERNGEHLIWSCVEDISERRRTETMLRESEEKLRLFIHFAPAAIAMFDRDMRYIAFSRRWLADYALGEREIAGRSHYEIFPDLPERWKEIHRRSLAGAVEECDEDPFPRADGSVDWVRWAAHPWRTGEGDIGGIMLFSEVITKQIQARMALQESEERLRMAARAGNVGLWDWNLRTNRVFFSPEWKRHIGYADHEIANDFKEWESRVHPDDLEPTLRVVMAYIHQPYPNYSVEFRFRHKDGSYRWILAQASLLSDAQGKPEHMLGAHIDITERKQAEEKLRASEKRLHDLIDGLGPSLFVGLLTLDGIIIEANRPALEAANLKLEDVLGKPVEDTYWFAYSETVQRQLRAAILQAAQGESSRYDVRIRAAEDQFIDIDLSLQPLRDETGKIAYLVPSASDITERKQAETKLQQLNAELELRVAERTAQLEAANRELDTFAYSVSHDLKAPLRGIDGYSQLLQEDCAARLDGDCRMFVDNIRQAAGQMHALIDDLLAYSRMERQTLHSAPLDLIELVRAVVAEQEDAIRQHGADMRLELPPLTAQADRNGMAMVLRNLLGNALKFTRDASPPVIEVGGRAEAESTILWIRDNGIGFDMKFHDRIFEIFQRLQRSEEYPGTGIGLALVTKAMQRMNGRAWAESAPGRGATFYLELPRAQADIDTGAHDQ